MNRKASNKAPKQKKSTIRYKIVGPPEGAQNDRSMWEMITAHFRQQ